MLKPNKMRTKDLYEVMGRMVIGKALRLEPSKNYILDKLTVDELLEIKKAIFSHSEMEESSQGESGVNPDTLCSQSQQKGINCPECGQEMKEGSKFCHTCKTEFFELITQSREEANK